MGSAAAELGGVRARGFATNEDEWIAGLSVVAAPVIVRDRLRAALAVAAATPRMRELDADATARRVVAAADAIAARLSGAAS